MRQSDKRLWSMALAVMLVCVMTASASAADYTIRAVTAWPETVYEVQNFTKFMELVKQNVAEKAADRLEINYLGGPEVIPNREQVEALRNGIVDMVFTTSGYYVSMVPVIDAMNLSSYKPWQEREKGINDFLNDIHNEKVNAQYLGRLGIDLPFQLFINTPIQKVDDLKGMKIRCSPTHIAFLKKVGAQPVVIPPPDVHTAVERGVVDGFIWVAGLIRDWGWHEVVKYRVEPGFYLGVNVVLVNKEVWDRLPEDLRQIVMQSQMQAEKLAVERAENHLASENREMEKGGMQVIRLSPPEARKLTETANSALWEIMIQKAGDDARKLRQMISD